MTQCEGVYSLRSRALIHFRNVRDRLSDATSCMSHVRRVPVSQSARSRTIQFRVSFAQVHVLQRVPYKDTLRWVVSGLAGCFDGQFRVSFAEFPVP